jgi:pyridoxamine 5'-phosphate oxidase
MSDLKLQLENLRIDYKKSAFNDQDADESPMEQFNKWFAEAVHSQCDEPNAFTLSTIKDGKPRSRVVLLKGTNERGFII